MRLNASKALAALQSRDHVLPDDVQALAVSGLSHRLLLAPEAAGVSRREIVEDALERVPALWAGDGARGRLRRSRNPAAAVRGDVRVALDVCPGCRVHRAGWRL